MQNKVFSICIGHHGSIHFVSHGLTGTLPSPPTTCCVPARPTGHLSNRATTWIEIEGRRSRVARRLALRPRKSRVHIHSHVVWSIPLSQSRSPEAMVRMSPWLDRIRHKSHTLYSCLSHWKHNARVCVCVRSPLAQRRCEKSIQTQDRETERERKSERPRCSSW